MTTTVQLTLPQTVAHSYPIILGENLLSATDVLQAHIPQKHVCLVSNETVDALYGNAIRASLDNKRVVTICLPDGERYKTIEQYTHILDTMMIEKIGRDAVVVALGGGVVGDIAGFAAATYQRGIAFVQLPTTLLAQVDSSVGGKTGVNHPLGKNMIGAFYQPQAVMIDTTTLRTLPSREFSAGMAEVIKYGLINNRVFFEWLEQHMDAIISKDDSLLQEMIAQCCIAKADIVRADEHEQGMRALLNLGHTFGHALESLTEYQRWRHGEAIAIGMRIAAVLSYMQKGLSMAEVTRITTLLTRAGLPVVLDGDLSTDDIIAAMQHDKKIRDGKLRLVLMRAFGVSEIVDTIPLEAIRAAIDAARI